MPKIQRSATTANESDILHLIDERFEDLEETVALAGSWVADGMIGFNMGLQHQFPEETESH